MSSALNRHSVIGLSHNQDMVRNAVGVRLRYARKLRGLTQQELAKASGVKQATISDIETGESQSPVGTNLVALAQSLRVSPEWMAQGKGDMDQTESPLPPEAIEHAKEWLKLAPDVRDSVAKMVRQMVKTSSADTKAVDDTRVEEAFGRPGVPDRRKPQRR